MKNRNDQVAETAVFRSINLAATGAQVGVLRWMATPGNATHAAPIVTIWEGAVISLIGLEANSNAISSVRH